MHAKYENFSYINEFFQYVFFKSNDNQSILVVRCYLINNTFVFMIMSYLSYLFRLFGLAAVRFQRTRCKLNNCQFIALNFVWTYTYIHVNVVSLNKNSALRLSNGLWLYLYCVLAYI